MVRIPAKDQFYSNLNFWAWGISTSFASDLLLRSCASWASTLPHKIRGFICSFQLQFCFNCGPMQLTYHLWKTIAVELACICAKIYRRFGASGVKCSWPQDCSILVILNPRVPRAITEIFRMVYKPSHEHVTSLPTNRQLAKVRKNGETWKNSHCFVGSGPCRQESRRLLTVADPLVFFTIAAFTVWYSVYWFSIRPERHSKIQTSTTNFSSLNVDVLLHLIKFVHPYDRLNLALSGILKGFENLNKGIGLRERYSQHFTQGFSTLKNRRTPMPRIRKESRIGQNFDWIREWFLSRFGSCEPLAFYFCFKLKWNCYLPRVSCEAEMGLRRVGACELEIRWVFRQTNERWVVCVLRSTVAPAVAMERTTNVAGASFEPHLGALQSH